MDTREESPGKRQKEEKKESVLRGGIEGLDGVTLGSKAASRRTTRAIMAYQQKNQKEEEEEVGVKKKPRRNRVRLGTGTAKNELELRTAASGSSCSRVEEPARTVKEEEMEEEDEELSMDMRTGMEEVERELENEGREPESQEERGALADVEGMQKKEPVEKKKKTRYEESRESLQKTLYNLATRRFIRPQQQPAPRPSHQNSEREMSTKEVRVKVNVKSRNIFVFPNCLNKTERKREQEEEEEEVLEDGAFGPMNFDPEAKHVLQVEKAWKEQAAEKKKNMQKLRKEVKQKVTQTPHVYVPPPVYKEPTICCIPVGVKLRRLQDANKSSYWVNQPFRSLIRVKEEHHKSATDAWLDKVCHLPKTKYTPEEIQANVDLHVRSELAKNRGEPPIEWRPLPRLVNPLHIPWVKPVAGEAETNGSASLTAEESPTTVDSNNEGAKGPEVAEISPASPAWICPWNELGEALSDEDPEQDGMERRFFSVEDGDDWLRRQETIRAEFQEMEENYEDYDDDVPGPSNRFF